jgi:5-formyltetrahydrofolate cyclo-ligase
MTDLRQQKKELRRMMETRRAEAFAQNPDAAIALRDNFLKTIALPPSGIISGTIARGSEMNPQPLLDALRMRGYHIALPVVKGKGTPLIFRLYNPGDELVLGAMNILEPTASVPAVEPDILLVPLLAFDRHGNRLGYGGGYYDRTLAALRAQKPILATGIAFACQEVAAVPVSSNDARLDKIVTEFKHFQP